MVSSSEDSDVPLVQRPVFMLAKATKKAVVIESDSGSDLPSWMKSADKGRVPIPSTSSDSELGASQRNEPASAPAAGAEPAAAAAAAAPAAAPPSSARGMGKAVASPAPNHRSAEAGAPPSIKKRPAGALGLESVPGRLPLVLPDRLAAGKILVELEPSDTGATDLSGDSGAIGRVLVSRRPGAPQQLQVDLKGVLYNAAVVPTPVTMAVVNVGATEAKIECLFTEFVQLRADTHFAANCHASTGVGALDEDEDDHYAMADGDDGEGPAGGKKTKPGSSAKAVAAAARKKPAARAPAKARGGVRKPAAKKPRAKPAARKAAPRKM